MRIYVTASEEPVFINPFLREVIRSRPSEFVGIAVDKGTPLRVYNQNRFSYLLALVLIMSPWSLVRRTLTVLKFKFYRLVTTPQNNPCSLHHVGREFGIPVRDVENVNAPEFLEHLREVKPDVIISQCHSFLKEGFLSVPVLGTLNRHAALLPKYRGRLAPFWAYTKMESHVGLSVHFVEIKLDAGPIVVQKSIPIERFDTLDSLLKKIFRLAPRAMIEALDLLKEDGCEEKFIPNLEEESSYFSSPKVKDAFCYRLVMIRRFLNAK